MLKKIFWLYTIAFARKRFQKFNKLLYFLSLHGLGILNYENSRVSGEERFLKTYLANKSGIVLDIGANQGNYTENVIKYNSMTKVYAFEPHPVTWIKLRDRFRDSPSVVIVNQGMSNESGSLMLYDYRDRNGSSHASLFSDVITDIHSCDDAFSHLVELTTLDKFSDENNIQEICLLKIDVEGNELKVLKGAQRLIKEKRINAIHFEFNEMNTCSRSFFRDFWQILEDFKLYRLLPESMLEIHGYSPVSCEIFAYQNIVAIRDC